MRSLSFASPERLWLIVAELGAFLAVWAAQRLRSGRTEPYAQPALIGLVAPHRAGWRRQLAVLGVSLALLLLTAAFARPQVLAAHSRERAAVVLALDASSSMLANDVPPDRFRAAKTAAKHFLRSLPARVDAGLVAFNANVRVVAAPTAQHERVAAAVDEQALSGGTAMGDALLVALRAVLAAVPPGPHPAARIVLLSDGGSTTGTSLSVAIAQVARAHVPVSTIAYGTPAGVVRYQGRVYPVPVDPAALSLVAAGTGGAAYDAATADQLRAVYAGIGSSLAVEVARTGIADRFAGAALLLLVATAGASLVWFGRLV
ncbi:MAG: VWA domain-containing protein [Mycobacteriales bacterium]